MSDNFEGNDDDLETKIDIQVPKKKVFDGKIVALAVVQSITLAGLVLVSYLLHESTKSPPIVMNVTKQVDIPSWYADVCVRIRAPFAGMGSGVAISDTLLLTNYHVVANLGQNGTLWVDSNHGVFVGKVKVLDQARDIAIIEVPKANAFSRWAAVDTRTSKWGEGVTVVGCANGNLPMPTTGYFVRDNSLGSQISCLAFFGNSGGPVFNKHGGLIGLVTTGDTPTDKSGTKVFPSHIFNCTRAAWLADFLSKNLP